MKGMSRFQIILTGIFAAFILIGVLVFSMGGIGGSSSISTSPVLVWGTISNQAFQSFTKDSGIDDNKAFKITYVQKSNETFDEEFIEALASGKGPDLFFLPQSSIVKHEDKIFPIPYKTYPQRTFLDNFIEEGELYLRANDIIALPFMIDPMVMYWNRDLFTNETISLPPKNWSELYDLTAKLTKKDSNLNVSQSTISFGEYGNVTNAFEIVSLLTMQAGNPITKRDAKDKVNSIFSSQLNFPVSPANRAVSFYTDFANPLKPYYSWNRSLPSSKNFFLAGDLAIYLGFASEAKDIRLKNPNLNFDIAPIPQTKDSAKNITFGRMIGLAVTKNSKQKSGAVALAIAMTSQKAISSLTTATGLPPVLRSLLAVKPTESYMSVFYDAAIQSRAWISPETAKSDTIFKSMIEAITGGRLLPNEAISRANDQIGALVK